jgi:hypothetical protein
MTVARTRRATYPQWEGVPVRVEHERAGRATVLARDVELADGVLSRARGLMFRRRLPDGAGMAFTFGRPARRTLHMAFVPFDIDAVWTVDGEVTRVERLRAWRGIAGATADAVFELPAGAAADVEPGDTVRLVDGECETRD